MRNDEVAVWLLTRIGTLVFLFHCVMKPMKNNDDKFGMREWFSVMLLFLTVFFVLWLTSGTLYK